MPSLAPPPVWNLVRQQAERLTAECPSIAPLLRQAVLDRSSFADALAHRLAGALQGAVPEGFDLVACFAPLLDAQPRITDAAQADLHKLATSNPACPGLLAGFLSFRGFQALQLHRIDHAIGLVVGATAVIEDGANLWHGVTLGSTLTQAGDRHPKLRRGVTVGAGATLLGNIEIGEGAVVAAGSVVLRAVEPFTVVAGVPARVVGDAGRPLAAIAARRGA